ncbi:hypothetical protein RRG08_065561 [Elysia crispata]|uniref:Xaa-Pro aminopeptidase 1 n=1 Tax=Elysia crispata TaxID=231223 RepID=A0AAE0YSV1_9GAST|nr:hypothetical protein RRG08_065561 [Elysia crispata]
MVTRTLLLLLCLAAHHVKGQRLACGAGDTPPSNRVNTTDRLEKFRTELSGITVSQIPVMAFIVGSPDAHNSEYPTKHDERRAFISGFSGSAGTAVITQTKAALWADGRYYLEADEVLDCNWELMKEGLPGTQTIAEWLNSELSPRAQVGIDRTLVSNVHFLELQSTLSNMPKQLVLHDLPENSNPVDTVWELSTTPTRPAQPMAPINALDIKFAGKTWQDKIDELRTSLTSLNAETMVISALDEIAWLFNLRGNDIQFNPFFLAYAIVEPQDISLYILDKTNRLTRQPSDAASTVTMAEHLNINGTTESCTGMTGKCVQVKDYSQALADVTAAAQRGPVFVTHDTNYAIYLNAQNNRVVGKSPVALAKSQKNSVERAGMQAAYNRDSAALVKFLAFLEKEIEAGRSWTEVSAGAELDKRRGELQYSRGLSFETISGYGSNGAIIHYRPAAETDKTIGTDSMYLLDSGGQYLDGTTDVTRTMHYGTPTAEEKEAYTRVLMSAINLALLVWPEQIYGRQIDAIARYALWEAGLVYRHGTGHGIGAYLSVHEGPGRISLVHGVKPKDEYLHAYQYFSDGPGDIEPVNSIRVSDEPLIEHQYFTHEPGYYKDGGFGIRLETIVMVDKTTTKYTTSGEQFHKFKAITFVPFEPKLIDYSYMNAKQVNWLNDYNVKVREQILPLISDDQTAIDWLNSRTEPISSDVTCGRGTGVLASGIIVAVLLVASGLFSTIAA